MAQASGKGRRAGILGAAVGVVAAGAAVGFTVERLTIGRAVRRMASIHDPGEPFGTLRGDPSTVTATDGVELYVEIDEPRGWAASPPRSGSGPAAASANGAVNGSAGASATSPNRPADAASAAASGGLAAAMRSAREAATSAAAPRPTLLFTHGFCLPQDCWHYQRAEFSATHRMVFWDQRGHGRSERPPQRLQLLKRHVPRVLPPGW